MLEVAPELLGCVVWHGAAAGVIVETEAYHFSEPACHAFVGVTPRTRVLHGPPGTAYVYRSYGIHALLNAVCEDEGVGAAVLIRALAPLRGLDQMRSRRGSGELCNGPGKLTQALGISLAENGTSLVSGPGADRRGLIAAVRRPDRGSGSPRRRSCRGGSALWAHATSRGPGRRVCWTPLRYRRTAPVKEGVGRAASATV